MKETLLQTQEKLTKLCISGNYVLKFFKKLKRLTKAFKTETFSCKNKNENLVMDSEGDSEVIEVIR